MSPTEFINDLKALKFVNTFNPYTDLCPVHDYSDAPKRRRTIILEILEYASSVPIDAIWIGRDLGYRGGRRTGLALTDDVHFEPHLARWKVTAQRPTRGIAMPERTADNIWDVLENIDEHVFLWNVFPLHPYSPNNPFSNRQHNTMERRAGILLLKKLLLILRPRRIVTIGNDAAKVVSEMQTGTESLKVRHPSYGGQTEFLRQMRAIYGLETSPQRGFFDSV
jgi:hypothetical protein